MNFSLNVFGGLCGLQFAPTASAVTTIALLDAMVSAVAVERGFNEKDYARFHAAGSLGKMLLGNKSLEAQSYPWGGNRRKRDLFSGAYLLKVELITLAAMTHLITALMDYIHIPMVSTFYGSNCLD